MKSYLNSHRINEEIIEIEMIFIAKEDRNKGEGTKLYLEWEKSLPKEIKCVKLFAADTGSGNSYPQSLEKWLVYIQLNKVVVVKCQQQYLLQ